MRAVTLFLLIFLSSVSVISVLVSQTRAAGPEVSVYGLRCEFKLDPIGIDVERPRLSWKIRADHLSMIQSAYQIRSADRAPDLLSGQNLLWDTGRVSSGQSIHIPYSGPDLTSGRRVFWQVRIWDGQGRSSPWSDPAYWEMGILNAEDWKSRWIEPDLEEDKDRSNPCPMLRRVFSLDKTVESARAYVTAHGLYELHINGRRVGEQVFTPGWTAYDLRLQYQSYDVTEHLRPGKNAVGVILGDGWHRGYLGFQNSRNTYGDNTALLARLEVVYADGTREIISTDEHWKATTGPILASDIYQGETYDARLEMEGWSLADFDDKGWNAVEYADIGFDRLVAPAGPPVRKIEEVKPVKILETPEGITVVDMGQNIVGWCRIRVQGAAGTRVTLRHAEVLDKEGNFYTDNLRSAKQEDVYILKGGGVEIYEPRFTFHGFRYVAVDGWPGKPSLEDITGVVVHSAIEPTGSFECSNPMINQLQHNIRWGQKGNFLDVPTDCPQRDERLGWTGDAQAFARTACFIADCAGFFTKWLADLAADQKPSGAVPHVIPDVINRRDPVGGAASAGWADAATVVPWTVYLCYGDVGILEKQYSSMKAWVDYMARKAGSSYVWNQDFTFGDWLAFNTTSSDYPGATTDKDLITQAYFARSTDLLIRAARVLGRTGDAEKYTALLEKIRRVFLDEFVTPNGRLASNTQTAYSLALAFDLLPERLRPAAAERLAADVRKFKHITTGFLGTPLICHVLSDFGYWDEAFMLLNRTEYPSWLYPITKGATTIWERWDGIKPDGSFQDRGMNSFNHYAYGAIGEWLYRKVAGIEIDPREPGYRHIFIQPHPGGGLKYVKASLETPYGPVACDWSITENALSVVVQIPPNTSATVTLPWARAEEATVGGRALVDADSVAVVREDPEALVLKVGSGEYRFVYAISGNR